MGVYGKILQFWLLRHQHSAPAQTQRAFLSSRLAHFSLLTRHSCSHGTITARLYSLLLAVILLRVERLHLPGQQPHPTLEFGVGA